MNFNEVVQYLENLTIMPKTMPGLEKIRGAVAEKSWFKNLDSKKIITVAGTNGKGTTCSTLEALLLSAKKNVGLYTSPHLVQTTERIRINGVDISEIQFVNIFLKNKQMLEKHELSHFEALTLMAADYFFSENNLDYVIFEVGLGGTYDATNIFPNHYSVITKLGLDHTNILGPTLQHIAKNKFGIIKNDSVVVHHQLPAEIHNLKNEVQRNTNSDWILAKTGASFCGKNKNNLTWKIDTPWGEADINLPGARAVENAMTALTLFEQLGFKPSEHIQALNQILLQGRMQKINWPNMTAPIYLSGDHNPQGVDSLIEILNNYDYKTLHLVVGVGQDKSCDEMFEKLISLPNMKLYLTETPFKGRAIYDYPTWIIQKSKYSHSNVENILDQLETISDDLVVVTGSLYLVGKIIKLIT